MQINKTKSWAKAKLLHLCQGMDMPEILFERKKNKKKTNSDAVRRTLLQLLLLLLLHLLLLQRRFAFNAK